MVVQSQRALALQFNPRGEGMEPAFSTLEEEAGLPDCTATPTDLGRGLMGNPSLPPKLPLPLKNMEVGRPEPDVAFLHSLEGRKAKPVFFPSSYPRPCPLIKKEFANQEAETMVVMPHSTFYSPTREN